MLNLDAGRPSDPGRKGAFNGGKRSIKVWQVNLQQRGLFFLSRVLKQVCMEYLHRRVNCCNFSILVTDLARLLSLSENI